MKKLFLIPFALISVFFSSCEDEKKARIEVWLTDDPGDYQEVNVDVQGVEIHSNDTESDKGWKALEVTPKVYDLLKLANGEETFLGDLELPGGRLSQIRLKLGEGNSVTVDGQVYPLNTPSAQQSGLKVKIDKVLTEGIAYKIILDFDAAKSVVETGAGTYILKPVIRAITEANGGSISGKVEPAGVASIAVWSGEEAEPVTTTATNEEGEFLIRGIAEGSYRLTFDGPGDEPIIEKDAVEVKSGEVTDIGVVSITP
jgi:hypothetical protein